MHLEHRDLRNEVTKAEGGFAGKEFGFYPRRTESQRKRRWLIKAVGLGLWKDHSSAVEPVVNIKQDWKEGAAGESLSN